MCVGGSVRRWGWGGETGVTYVGFALAEGRRLAESLMTDMCLIQRVSGTATDPDTGESVVTYSQVYSGKCRFQARGDWSVDRDIGEAGLVLLQTELQVPVSVVVAVNDRVTVQSSTTATDLTGRVFTVRGVFLKTHDTSNKAMLIEVTG